VDIIKLLIILTLLAIVWSLGTALYQLARKQGDPDKMLRALTWRSDCSSYC